MNKFFENRIISKAAAIILGGLFIYASMDKMANPEAFLKIIHNYKLLPVQLENPLAIFLPWLEFFTGLMLVIGKWKKAAWLMMNVMLIVFIFALAQALVRGLDISCGCFSVQPSTTSAVWLRIIEDLVMLFFSIFSYKYSEKEKSPEIELSQN